MRNHEMFPSGGAADAARRSEGGVAGAMAAGASAPRGDPERDARRDL